MARATHSSFTVIGARIPSLIHNCSEHSLSGAVTATQAPHYSITTNDLGGRRTLLI